MFSMWYVGIVKFSRAMPEVLGRENKKMRWFLYIIGYYKWKWERDIRDIWRKTQIDR